MINIHRKTTGPIKVTKKYQKMIKKNHFTFFSEPKSTPQNLNGAHVDS